MLLVLGPDGLMFVAATAPAGAGASDVRTLTKAVRAGGLPGRVLTLIW